MTLLNPTTGELLDRLSILKLKILNGQKLGKYIQHFLDEQNEILEALAAKEDAGIDIEEALVIGRELEQANTMLWKRTDEHKYAVEQVTMSFVELYELLAALWEANSSRCSLRARIDRSTGEFQGDEKV
jgi:hypothetical protein